MVLPFVDRSPSPTTRRLSHTHPVSAHARWLPSGYTLPAADIQPMWGRMNEARSETRATGGYRAVLAIPEFRRLWLAEVSARVGEAIAQVALPLLVYRLTESAGLMSVIFVIQMVPRAILAPVAGLLADRLD